MAVLSDNFNAGFDEGFGRDVLSDIQVGPAQPNIINVDPGDISGGSTSGSIAASNQKIEEFVAEAGGLLPKAYGECFIAGNLILHKYTLGTPNTSIIYVALGEGQGSGAGHGEWEEALDVYYAGQPLSVSPNGSTEGYRFYQGFISTAVASGPQPVDAFLPTGLSYSGTAYIAVKLPDDLANAEDRPDKLRGRYKCRRTFKFDSTGRVIDYGYSTNPARVAADIVLSYYERKFPLDPDVALRLLQEKIDWDAWKIWHDFNAELIEWDDGTTVRNIPRFEFHGAFTTDINLADALDQICSSCGAFWQDNGKQLVFLPPTEREPVHHFHPGNLLSKGISVEPRDLRNAHNYLIGEFRDQDDEFLGSDSVEVRVENLIKQYSENKVTHALTSMNRSQAGRLMNLRANLEVNNPNICAFIGNASSYRVLPGDFVTVSHPTTGWNYQRCLVLAATLSSANGAPDTCEFVVQEINGQLYSDTAHGPRQEVLTP
jgi:hypothetical protein